MSFGPGHTSQVRILYKTILRLHRGLPPAVKSMGDEYVHDEFKRHRSAEPQFVPVFMKEWTLYSLMAGDIPSSNTLSGSVDRGEPHPMKVYLNWEHRTQNYAITLAKQLGKKSAYATLGVPLKDNQLELMSDEQISQLFDLFQEIQGPTVPKTDSIDINIKADEGIPKS